MKINILTIFPEFFNGWKSEGIIKRAIEVGHVELNIIDFREYSANKHHKVDDYPYSGTEGMLLMVQPLDEAIIQNNLADTHVIFPSPIGQVFKQARALELSEMDEITLVAGRYEGVDQRFIDMHVDEQISLGDFILTGGEVAIEVILDAVIRLLPDVLGNEFSAPNDSFSNGLLEHPQYTRPAVYKNISVPEVLVNGHHKLIREWQLEQQVMRTMQVRPDLIELQTDPEILKKVKEINEKNS